MKNYNFIHIFLNPSRIFNTATQNLINELDLPYRHLFVYAFKEDTKNVSADNSIFDKSVCRTVGLKKYFEIGDYIIIHALNYTPKDITQLTDEECKRIIWCVWGHDLYTVEAKHNIFYLLARTIYRILKRRKYYDTKAAEKISKFKCIAAGFVGDKFTIKEKFGKHVAVYQALYPMGYCSTDLEKWEEPCKQYDSLRILLGNSAYQFLNHDFWIEKLKPYKDKIELYLPLSYGNDEYAKEIKVKAINVFGGDKVYCLEKFTSSKEYFKYLCNIDIAIFDYKHQSAFGNILLLLYLKKRIYLNPNGIMYKGLKSVGLDVFTTDELIEREFHKKLCCNISDINRKYTKEMLDYSNIKLQWKNLFKQIYTDDVGKAL